MKAHILVAFLGYSLGVTLKHLLPRVATPNSEQQRLLTQLGITLPERFNLNFECSANSAMI